MEEIGLFPLGIVLLPTERVPLHIFEPRYRELIGECLEDDTEFGLIYADEEGVREIGTLARVADVLERFIETMFALAADGKLSKRGLPSPVRLATIANAHFADSRAPYIPAWVQKAGLAAGAALGRTLGYEPAYDMQTPAPQLVPATA